MRHFALIGFGVLGLIAVSARSRPAPSSDVGLALPLIKKWESFRGEAYPDPADPVGGPITIGYGTTIYPDGSRPQIGDILDEPTAAAYLLDHVTRDVLPALHEIPRWIEMSPHQRAALISFAYNLGAHFYGAPGFATITSALGSPEWAQSVPDALGLYVFANGRKLPGLVRRRADEAEMWRLG